MTMKPYCWNFLLEVSNGFVYGVYKAPSQNNKHFLDNLSHNLCRLTCHYDKTMLIGDFNLPIENKNLEIFMSAFKLKCMIDKPICFRSENPSYIDLIQPNKKEQFKHSEVIQAGISDHQIFTVTTLKSQLVKGNAETKIYRDYSRFPMDAFKEDLDLD